MIMLLPGPYSRVLDDGPLLLEIGLNLTKKKGFVNILDIIE